MATDWQPQQLRRDSSAAGRLARVFLQPRPRWLGSDDEARLFDEVLSSALRSLAPDCARAAIDIADIRTAAHRDREGILEIVQRARAEVARVELELHDAVYAIDVLFAPAMRAAQPDLAGVPPDGRAQPSARVYLAPLALLPVVLLAMGAVFLAAPSSLGLTILLLATSLAAGPFVANRALRAWQTRKASRNPAYDPARAEVAATKDRLRKELLDDALAPFLRRYIEDRLRNSYSNDFDVDHRRVRGLHQLDDVSLEVPTDGLHRVRALMRSLKSGSIGISGPRGVGKTTIIGAICANRFPDEGVDSEVLAVSVAAPVEYAPRDFLLYLYAIVCARIEASFRPPAEMGRADRAWVRLLLRARHSIGPLIGITILLVGLSGIQLIVQYETRRILAATARIPPELGATIRARDLYIAWALDIPGGTLLVVGAGVALAQLPRNLNLLLLKWSNPAVRAVRRARLKTMWGLALMVAGITLRVSGLTIVRSLQSAGRLSLGVTIVVLAVLLSRARGMARRVAPGSSSLARRRAALADQAALHLQRIRFQQTFTSGWSGRLSLPVPPGLPVQLSSEMSRGRSLAELQRTLPELVADFRGLLAAVVRIGRAQVIIGIDELDKIESADRAQQFLRDMKAVFGVSGTFFLVSMSDDALVSFEARGMPVRDVFDSSFDTIVAIGYLTFRDTQRLLNNRVAGMPVPFLALAHAMSGGLPRDLIRVARLIVQSEHLRSIRSVAAELVRLDLHGKSLATRAALARSGPDVDDTLLWTDALPSVPTGELLLQRCDDAAALLRRLPAGTDSTVRSLIRDKMAHEYFCATVLDFFLGRRSVDDWIRAEGTTADPAAAVDQLARARQAFTSGLAVAWRITTEFRSAWNLSTKALPAWSWSPGDESDASSVGADG